MMAALISAAVSLTVAILGFAVTYRTTRLLHQRQAQLARINAQLSQLYGPLLTLSTTSDRTWQVFAKRYFDDRIAYFNSTPIEPERVDIWVTWMRTVFMPTNRRMYELIVAGGDLLVDRKVPPEFLKFCAHVSCYEAVLARWDAGDTSELTAPIDHPGKSFRDHIAMRFAALKKEQAGLLAASARRSRRHRRWPRRISRFVTRLQRAPERPGVSVSVGNHPDDSAHTGRI